MSTHITFLLLFLSMPQIDRIASFDIYIYYIPLSLSLSVPLSLPNFFHYSRGRSEYLPTKPQSARRLKEERKEGRKEKKKVDDNPQQVRAIIPSS